MPGSVLILVYNKRITWIFTTHQSERIATERYPATIALRIRIGDPTPVSDLVLAHNVDSVDAVVCSSTCTATVVPQTVTLTVHLRAPGSTDPVLDIVLTGQRRQT